MPSCSSPLQLLSPSTPPRPRRQTVSLPAPPEVQLSPRSKLQRETQVGVVWSIEGTEGREIPLLFVNKLTPDATDDLELSGEEEEEQDRGERRRTKRARPSPLPLREYSSSMQLGSVRRHPEHLALAEKRHIEPTLILSAEIRRVEEATPHIVYLGPRARPRASLSSAGRERRLHSRSADLPAPHRKGSGESEELSIISFYRRESFYEKTGALERVELPPKRLSNLSSISARTF
ncbi:hypothetical protein BCR35DRAFT_307531 [Leucosporidium creatinivorum]|uniref:Uncharacterized protein n=1 Tax=Leucosporidium creatinivorum TaxID=106004 RepID=A0A1Y2EMH3_9BASI|nr:hypothetical protein BCR35DRAFT_307531 [Leucosporidium creatinivorum]